MLWLVDYWFYKYKQRYPCIYRAIDLSTCLICHKKGQLVVLDIGNQAGTGQEEEIDRSFSFACR